MRTVNELLEGTKWGQLSQEEIDYVADKIKASTPENEENDLYFLITILGKSGAIRYRELNFLFQNTQDQATFGQRHLYSNNKNFLD